MKCFVLNGWAAKPEDWDLCAFPRDRIFGYGEQLDGVPERVLEATDEAVLVGWSMGGSTALRLALRHPEKVRGLVLVAATPRMMEAKDEGWSGMSERRLQSLCLGTRMMNEGDLSPVFDETLMLRGIDYLRKTDIRHDLEQAVSPDSPLRNIPVAVFQGERDGIVRPANAAFLKTVFPQAELTMVPTAEHCLVRTIPAQIDAAVRAMLGPADARRSVRPCCLTVAGSDSGGNAGVQADLRAFHAYGLHGCTVFAALTAQNPSGVSAVHPVPPDFVAAQLDAVLGTYAIGALKTGMLAESEIIETIADRLAGHAEIACVIDPVMIATSGAKLISDEAIETLKSRLLPQATVMTPNIPEAETLTGRAIRSRADVHEAARRLHGAYGCAVLVKGGHAVGDLTAAEDTLFDGTEFSSHVMPWVKDPVSTHGTGCSLAAALAAELTLGRRLKDAVAGAKAYVHQAIADSYLVGEGCGVLGFAIQKERQK